MMRLKISLFVLLVSLSLSHSASAVSIPVQSIQTLHFLAIDGRGTIGSVVNASIAAASISSAARSVMRGTIGHEAGFYSQVRQAVKETEAYLHIQAGRLNESDQLWLESLVSKGRLVIKLGQ